MGTKREQGTVEDHSIVGQRGLTRRDLLRKSAAGGAVAGAAWVAPTIMTLDRAAACGTCPQSSLTWANTVGNNGLNPDDTVIDGVRFDLSGTQVQAGTAVAPNFVVQTQAGSGSPFGAQNTWYQLRQNANAWSGTGATTSRIRFRLTFRNPLPSTTRVNVDGLCFLIVDVDNQSGSGWRDRIRIVPTLADGSAALDPVLSIIAGISPPGPSGLGTNASPLQGVGTANIVDTSTNGNVLVTFPGPVNRVDLFYENGAPPPPATTGYSGSIQRIGLTAFSWCDVTAAAGAVAPAGVRREEFDLDLDLPPTPMPGDGTQTVGPPND